MAARIWQPPPVANKPGTVEMMCILKIQEEGELIKSIVKNKYFIVGCIIVVLGLLTWATIDNIRKSVTVTFEYTPSNASLYINDKKVGIKTKITPGTHKASVRQAGFATYDEEIIVTKDETRTVYAVLEPNTDETANWYEEHPRDDEKRQQIYNKLATIDSERLFKNFPIKSILPYVGPSGGYRLDYGQGSNKNTQAVYVRYYTEKGKQLAQDYIKSEGFKLEDYEIIYEQLDFNAPTIDDGSEDFGAEDEHYEGDGHVH